MNWFVQYRQGWIAQTLKVYGFVNRRHLMRQFGISSAQAVVDFRKFNDENPSAMTYDNRQKAYIATKAPQQES